MWTELGRAPDTRSVGNQHSAREKRIFGGLLCSHVRVQRPRLGKQHPKQPQKRVIVGGRCLASPPLLKPRYTFCPAPDANNNNDAEENNEPDGVATFLRKLCLFWGCEQMSRARARKVQQTTEEKSWKSFFLLLPNFVWFHFNKSEHSAICASLFRQAPPVWKGRDTSIEKIPSIVHFTAFLIRDASFFFLSLRAVEHAECDFRLFIHVRRLCLMPFM